MPEHMPFVKKILHREHTITCWGQKRICHGRRLAVYSPHMSEPQKDYNAFNSWDSFGATLMLGAVPAVMYEVFTKADGAEADHTVTVLIVVAAVLISLVVLAVSLITRWRIIGTLVNLAGATLTPVYIAIAICAWLPEDESEAPPQPAAETAPQQPVPPAP